MSERQLAFYGWTGFVVLCCVCAIVLLLAVVIPLSPSVFWWAYFPYVVAGIICAIFAWRYGYGEKLSEREHHSANGRIVSVMLISAAIFAVLGMNSIRFDSALPFGVAISHAIVLIVLWLRRNYTWSKK